MCKILSRIKIIADSEGITIGAIERAIGASRGVISKAIAKGTDIQSKWLELICEKFPSYSPIWLLTGEGQMLRDSHTNSTDIPSSAKIIAKIEPSSAPHIESSKIDCTSKRDSIPTSALTELITTIREQAEEIGRLKAYIEQLEKERRDNQVFSTTNIPKVETPSPPVLQDR